MIKKSNHRKIRVPFQNSWRCLSGPCPPPPPPSSSMESVTFLTRLIPSLVFPRHATGTSVVYDTCTLPQIKTLFLSVISNTLNNTRYRLIRWRYHHEARPLAPSRIGQYAISLGVDRQSGSVLAGSMPIHHANIFLHSSTTSHCFLILH
jgi:hypothetical protein